MALFEGPTTEELNYFNKHYGFCCTNEELNCYSAILKDSIEPFQKIYQIPEYALEVKYPRTSGHRPNGLDNLLNAWYWKCSVKGASSGKLAGKRIGIKDSIFVAGIPLMNGSHVLEGFIPEHDATVVTRMLDEGAEIIGKTTCEDLCFSSASFLTTYGPVKNPWNADYSSGGSSSGSAVVVASGEADLAIGGDQGGSIRIPSSQCGIVGMKPTYGLVPYTGICSIDYSIDHTGPMAKNVADCALLLEVIAGYDNGNDFRQGPMQFTAPELTKELDHSVSDLRIGVLKEGFDLCESDVKQVVNKAIDIIQESGIFSTIGMISAPHHQEAYDAWAVVILSSFNQVADGYGHGTGVGGLLSSRFSDAMHRGLKTNAHSLGVSPRIFTMFGAFMKDKYGLAPYARAQSLIVKHRQLYNDLFDHVDMLLMPTVPATAPKIPDEYTTIGDKIQQAFSPDVNTAPFDASHHPALTLNAGFSDKNGLPVGLMLVGRHWQDGTVLRAANAIEKCLESRQTKQIDP